VFIVAVHVLISMALNIIFFDDYKECIYRCDHHFPAGVDDPTTPDPACSACPVEEDWETCAMGETAPINESRTCVDEEMPGLLASLITVAIVVPLIGLINVLVRPRPCVSLGAVCLRANPRVALPVWLASSRAGRRYHDAQR